jgi:limonene-1,2-epoxide hydrolase
MAQTVKTGAVERYLECLAANDWDGLAATVADEDLVRDGPYCDVVEGKQRYLKFLRNVFVSLEGYRLDVRRVSHVSDRVSYVELSETFKIDGVPTEYPECLVFEQNDDGLINRVNVFIKQLGN